MARLHTGHERSSTSKSIRLNTVSAGQRYAMVMSSKIKTIIAFGRIVLDYRIYDPDGDGKSKLDHVREMLTNIVYHKQLPFQAVLMDTWYATKDLMLFIESLAKTYYCPLKDNRQVDDARGKQPYQCVDALSWTADELAHGKRIKIKGFPKEHKVQLFRVVVSTHRTDYVVTNDWAQESTEATQEACGFRWKIEQ